MYTDGRYGFASSPFLQVRNIYIYVYIYIHKGSLPALSCKYDYVCIGSISNRTHTHVQTDEGAEDADAAVKEERRAAKALQNEAEGHAQTDEGAEDADAAVKERRSATIMPRYVSANYNICV